MLSYQIRTQTRSLSFSDLISLDRNFLTVSGFRDSENPVFRNLSHQNPVLSCEPLVSQNRNPTRYFWLLAHQNLNRIVSWLSGEIWEPVEIGSDLRIPHPKILSQ